MLAQLLEISSEFMVKKLAGDVSYDSESTKIRLKLKKFQSR